MASNQITAPNTHAHAALAFPAITPTLHPGGKIPCPHCGQIPYSRSNSTSRPPRVCSFRFFFPFFSNFVPQLVHTAASSPPAHSACALLIAASVIIRARNSDKRLSTSSSISRNVALGCCSRHSAIPLMFSSLFPFHLFRISSPFILPPLTPFYLTSLPRKNISHPVVGVHANVVRSPGGELSGAHTKLAHAH